MKIKKIQIENYRGFKNCEVDFHPNVNVLIGSNASGKTSMLRAIATSLYSITSSFVSSSNGRTLILNSSDVNYQSHYSTILAWIEDFPNYQQNLIPAILTNNKDADYLKNYRKDFASREEFLNWFSKEIGDGPMTLPVIKFYPANRGAIEYIFTTVDNYRIAQLEAWSNIYHDTLSYSKFFQWFLENETNELLLQRDARDFNVQSPRLRDVRAALNRAFAFLDYGEVKIKVNQIKREGSSELVPTLVLENIKIKKQESLVYCTNTKQHAAVRSIE